MKLILPVVLKPVSRKEDKSSTLRFDTRELEIEEIVELMRFEGEEIWICISSVDNF